jgi:hypothetical protein
MVTYNYPKKFGEGFLSLVFHEVKPVAAAFRCGGNHKSDMPSFAQSSVVFFDPTC